MNKAFRRFNVVTDQYGVDPLLDRSLDYVTSIQTYSLHNVTQAERGAPDLISENVYATDAYWWVILAYNGISSWRELVEGVVLKIPDLPSIISGINQNAIRPNKVQRTIRI